MVFPAAPTSFDPATGRTVDLARGEDRIWSMLPTRSGPSWVMPDLCIDVVWPATGPPRTLRRTLAPMTVELEAGASVCGLRLGPTATSVRVDWSWPGWAEPALDRRPAILRAALERGVIRVERQPWLATLLHALDDPSARVPAVARRVGLSERQLLRTTRASLGLSPKQLHRHLRLLRFCAADPGRPLSRRALDAGYCDQAHASREIRALGGLDARSLHQFRMAD